jgi:segregation and condensation protein A
MTMETVSPMPEPGTAGQPNYNFVLPSFEGPLDLLLHLIRSQELDITDLPMAEVAKQYAEMVNLMEDLNLDVAGEFLVMAATLVYIKSKLILPVDQDRIQEGLEEDPRQNLVQALLEHEQFRQAAVDLAEREVMASLVFTRQGDVEPQEQGYLEVGLFDLLNAFKGFLETSAKRDALTRRDEHIPLSDRIDQVRAILVSTPRIEFSELLPMNADLDLLVVTFLAILELMKTGFLRAVQLRPTGEIQLCRTET